MSCPSLLANKNCDETIFLSSFDSNDPSPTDSFLAYIAKLHEDQIISKENIEEFRENLEQNTWINPIKYSDTTYSSSKYIHFKTMQEYLDDWTLNREKILDWLVIFVETNHQQENLAQDSIKRTSTQIFNDQFLPITIHYQKMELASTLVTQKFWVEQMGENPSLHFDGPSSMELEVRGKIVRLNPDHPVENITWWSAQAFANYLSELYGYKPYYDFDYTRTRHFSGTRMENGTLSYNRNWFRANPRSNGFRLVNRQEFIFLMLETIPFMLGDKPNKTWNQTNSKNKTQAVAQLTPSIIEDYPFFDILGNVYQFTSEYSSNLQLHSPQLFGYDYKSDPDHKFLFTEMHGLSGPKNRETVGFRLIRNPNP